MLSSLPVIGRTASRRRAGRATGATAVKLSRGDRVTLAGIYAFLAFVVVVIVFPLLYVVAASFSSYGPVLSGNVWVWPVHPTLFTYETIFHFPEFWQSYLNAIIYTAASTALSVTLSVMLGYPLSRPGFVGKRLITFLLLFAFLFSGGIIPLFLLVKSLGMINTRWSMILPTALSIFSVIIARSFFVSSVPDALVEAAEVDGASDFTILRKIVLPISKPMLVVLALIYGVVQWNSYFYALIFLNSQSLYPLQLVLQQVLVLGQLSPDQISNLTPKDANEFEALSTLIKYALVVVSTLPMVLIYPYAQRYLVKGLRVGSLKG
ncbi:MAG TPA: carbohydrate ABC transporter permease [Acidimicrobiales bacterium]|jgi:putative aldouronate transport system permease protein|nr:carbohydrate ABC transporter permease [Acidimicrobiales bacterium]